MGKKSRDAEIASSKMFGRASKGQTMEQIIEVVIQTINSVLFRMQGSDGSYVYWYTGRGLPDPNIYNGDFGYWNPGLPLPPVEESS